ncbi:MAG: MFS transporter [Pseudomonadota bacterium]
MTGEAKIQTQKTTAETGENTWDRGYEIRAIALMSVGFGLVGLDRFIIYPLFPVMAEDLGLTYQHLGLISGVLALTWGLSSVFAGSLSDRFGAKRILIVSTIAFSFLVGLSGLAVGLISLLIIRGLMGIAEGGFVPASIVATIDASKPTRIGMNVGIQQMAAPLIGLGFGPLIAVGLLAVLPGWEWVFVLVALPGLVLAYMLHRVIKTPPATRSPRGDKIPFLAPFKHRNIVFAVLGMFCFFSCLNVLSTFMPSYLTDHVKLPIGQMGAVLSALGVGGFIGMVIVPAFSDRFGRKRVILIALVVEIAALFAAMNAGANVPILTISLFVVSFLNSGVVAITVGPLVNEAVPPAIAATATGFVVGLGEVFGGAVAPAIAGAAAQTMGIDIILKIALVAAILGVLVVAFGIKEPSATDASTAEPVSA